MSLEPDPDPIRPREAASETPAAGRRKRASGRASMRDEFLALFRDTRIYPPLRGGGPGQPPTTGAPDLPDASAGPSAAKPSPFLHRFLREAAPSSGLAPSGLARLDRRLGGGFGYGAHLVLGPPGSSTGAFLESVAWETVAGSRPALYYAFRTGSLGVWERLIATLGTILDGPAVTPAALQSQGLVDKDRETLTRLDAALQASVLPYLSLIDPTPACVCSASTFIEDIRIRAEEAGDQHGRLPLVLVDDLERLVALTESQSYPHLLARLDRALAAASIPGLVTGSADVWSGEQLAQVPVQTVLTLMPVFLSADGSPERLEMEVRKNAATRWTGRATLLLDPWSGLFAEAAAGG